MSIVYEQCRYLTERSISIDQHLHISKKLQNEAPRNLTKKNATLVVAVVYHTVPFRRIDFKWTTQPKDGDP